MGVQQSELQSILQSIYDKLENNDEKIRKLLHRVKSIESDFHFLEEQIMDVQKIIDSFASKFQITRKMQHN